MLQKTSHFMRQANLINGEWVQADSGQTIDVTNPANGLKIGTVPKAGATETRRAIEAAHAAFLTWRKTSALERSKLLRKLHDAIMDNQDALAELLTTEQGKSLFEARGEVGSSAAYVLWFAEEGRRTYGDVVPSPWADRRIIVTKEPVGVVAAITPWNFPSSMLARKLGPALAAAPPSSSPPRRRLTRRWPGARWQKKSASRRAWSTSSPGPPAKSAMNSASTRWSRRSPSLARPRSARC